MKKLAKVYRCPICGFHYETKELAKKCESFCKTHSACSLEITNQAIERKEK